MNAWLPAALKTQGLSRWLLMVAAVSLIAALVPAPAWSAPTDEQPTALDVPASDPPSTSDDGGPLERPDEASAFDLAIKTQQRVEVTNKRSEHDKLFANPDGTLTQEHHFRPVRVRNSDGAWTPVDTTLNIAGDGSVAPVATRVGLRFSGGGAAPMAAVSYEGKSLALSWRANLPAPTLEGSTAVYANVLPDVDLRVTADVDGFSEVLVVKTREAATLPEVAQIRLGVAATGLTVSVDAGGRLAAVDSAGTEIFTAPTPFMWDSSGDGDAQAFATEPGYGARESAMPTRLEGDELIIEPDQEMLTDPATVYPVYVDPSVGLKKLSWTYIESGTYANENYLNVARDAPIGAYSEGGQIRRNRSYFYYDTTPVRGKQVLSAEFRTYMVHSYNSCTARPVEVWITDGISGSTTWNNPPAEYTHLATKSVAHNAGNASCPAAWVGFDVTSGLQAAANGNWSRISLGMRVPATYEGNVEYRKKVQNNPALNVTYNSIPLVPTDLSIEPCFKACASPGVTSSLQATLKARVTDPDGAPLWRVEFEVWSADKSTRVAYVHWSVTNQPSGQIASWKQNTPRAEDTTYHWKTRACDYSSCGGWSTWFTFTTDTSNPTIPTVASTEYPCKTLNGGTWAGGIGISGSVTFGPNQATDVAEYRWSLGQTPPTTPATPGTDGSATVTITPTRDREVSLYVQSINAAGGKSEIAVCEIWVYPAIDVAAWWLLDETAGTTATDTAQGNEHPGTLSGGVTWGDGRVSNGASFSGTDGCISTTGPVLYTNGSFTVTAWVRLTEAGGFRTAVSQDGNRSSGFYLQYRPDSDSWAFTMRVSDTDAGQSYQALSPYPPTLDMWVHLAGIYDAQASQLRLYVNGEPAGVTPFTSTWTAPGGMQIGRGKYAGSPVDWWAGAVDEVKVTQRALDDTEILYEYQQYS